MDTLTQFSAVAQGSDMEEWVNILFIAVVAILWLVGGLIKAAGRKGPPQQRRREEGIAQEQRRQRETWQQRLARKAEEMQRAMEAKSKQAAERMRRTEEEARQRAQGERPRTRPAQPPGGTVTVRSGPRGESILIYEQPGEQVSAAQEEQIARQREAREAVAAARRHTTQPPPSVESRIEVGAAGTEPIYEGLTGIMLEPPKPLEPREEKLRTPRESAGFQPGDVLDYGDSEALKKAVLHYEILGKPLALREPSERTAFF